jgi:outer membrane lipoprotein-sorting protein
MKYLSILFITLFTFSGYGQTSKEARALLEEVKTKTLSFENQKITFSNVLEVPNSDPDKASTKRSMEGTIFLKGESYRLEMNDVIYLYDTKKLHIIDIDSEEIDITSVDEETPLSPTSILNEFDKGYSLKLENKKTIEGKSIQFVRLKPTGASDVLDVLLGIDTKTKTIYSYQMLGMNKVVTVLTITDYQTNLSLPANTFVYNESDWEGFYIN